MTSSLSLWTVICILPAGLGYRHAWIDTIMPAGSRRDYARLGTTVDVESQTRHVTTSITKQRTRRTKVQAMAKRGGRAGRGRETRYETQGGQYMVVYGGGCICICNADCNKWTGHECVCEGAVVMHRRAEEDNSRDCGQAKSVGLGRGGRANGERPSSTRSRRSTGGASCVSLKEHECLVRDSECAGPMRLPEIRLAVSYVNMSCRTAC